LQLSDQALEHRAMQRLALSIDVGASLQAELDVALTRRHVLQTVSQSVPVPVPVPRRHR
jgi:hypothetical protein